MAQFAHDGTPEPLSVPRAPRHDELLAAVDLGSNSFHLWLVRLTATGTETLVHRRDSVRLAAGVDGEGYLRPAARLAALKVLREYARHLEHVAPGRVHAAATEAVRRLADVRAFLAAATVALGHPVRAISGREEAWLIWRGAVHALPASDARRLVIDIGGGSTECILGRGAAATHLASVPVGCVASSLASFPDGKLDRRRWMRARDRMRAALAPVAERYAREGWDEAWACAGTAVTLERMAQAAGHAPGALDPAALEELVERILDCGHVDEVRAAGLDREHAPIAAGGLLVMQAVVDAFGLRRLNVRDFAMRHGLLRELIEPSRGLLPRAAGDP